MKLKDKNKPAGTGPALAQINDAKISFWIDSSGGPKELCNQSFYGVNPKYYLYGSLNEAYLVDCESGAITFDKINCFDFLEEKINEEKHNKDGIFVGYFAYDLFQGKSTNYPDFFFAYFENTSSVILSDSEESHNVLRSFVANAPQDDILLSNMSDPEYLKKVREVKEEIKAGNVYQVNLTREYFLEDLGLRIKDLDLYLRLREASPNPFGCFFKTPFVTLLSSSPEEFLYIKPAVGRDSERAKRIIRTRPIKGTMPKDIFNIDPKNQAENIMIVDLERNDLGRICKFGSVKASKLLKVESYKQLNHVVSTVEGELKNEISLKQIFEATFPSGSITGAPKIAAMKIIDRIEPTKRSAYTGTFGYIKTDGTMDFNILIRTIFIRPIAPSPHRRIVFNVGGGIVADSDPLDELEEIKLKAKGIMSALGMSKC